MATPRTVNTWPLNGTQREFDLTFDYLSRNFVKVTILGGPLPIPLTQGTDFVFVTNTRIRTTVAYGNPNTLIEIRRVTSTTERLVEFQDASILHALDLNIDALQVLHVAEEAREAATETIGVNNDGHLDARGRRIVNGQDPLAPQDLATKAYIDGNSQGAVQARIAAEAARDAAKGHRDAAASSATQSAQSASTAGTYADTAKTHQDAAKASQDASKVSQDASKASENAASASAGASQTSADASKASELKAKDWAEKLPGSVESGAYSAKYWAQQAAAGVIPDDAIVETKMPVRDESNMFPDHNFYDVPKAWTATDPETLNGITVFANATYGRTMRVTMDTKGGANGMAWNVRCRLFKVIPGSVLLFTSMVYSSGTAGSYRIEILWRNAAGDSIGAGNVVIVGNPVAPVTGGMVNLSASVTVPSGAVYGAIQLRGQNNGQGAWKGAVEWFFPMVKQYIAAPAGAIAFDQLSTSLQATINTNGTDISQLKTDTSGLRTDLNSTSSALSQLDGRENTRWGQTVRKVNGATPDLEGNVNVSGGVPFDSYGKIGDYTALLIEITGNISASTVYTDSSGTPLWRMKYTGGAVVPHVRAGGTWRVGSVISGYGSSGVIALCQRIG